jgi:hypothetical protein
VGIEDFLNSFVLFCAIEQVGEKKSSKICARTFNKLGLMFEPDSKLGHKNKLLKDCCRLHTVETT